MRVQRILVKISKSFGSLLAVGALALIATAAFGLSAPAARAATTVISDQPNIGVVGKVVGAKLTGEIRITNPVDQQHFTNADIVVSGICPPGSLVTIYDNQAIRASGRCTDAGTFAIPIELFIGQNILQAKAVTQLNQGDLWSNIVTVYLDVPASCGTGLFRLLPVEGVIVAAPSASVLRHLVTIGGTPPYKLTWSWGDGKVDTSDAPAEGQTELSHVYASTGIYTIKVRAVDKFGAVANTQLVTVIINPTAVDLPGQLLGYWPILLMAILLVLTYLWGRHRGREIEQKLDRAKARAALQLRSEQEANSVKVSAAPGPAYVGRVAPTMIPVAPAPAAPMPMPMPTATPTPAPTHTPMASPTPATAHTPMAEPAKPAAPLLAPLPEIKPLSHDEPVKPVEPHMPAEPNDLVQPTKDN